MASGGLVYVDFVDKDAEHYEQRNRQQQTGFRNLVSRSHRSMLETINQDVSGELRMRQGTSSWNSRDHSMDMETDWMLTCVLLKLVTNSVIGWG